MIEIYKKVVRILEDIVDKYTKPLPKIGDDIYVGSAFYIGHGVDDFQGGLCKVSDVEEGTSAGKPAHFITVEERPTTKYNWKFLAEKQEELKKRFGDIRGYRDPDYDPQFNNP